MLLRHAIGAALRRIRLERGLTLREVSRASSVSMPYLSEIERGRKEASSEILATVCRVLDLTVFELLGEVRAAEMLGSGLALVSRTSLGSSSTENATLLLAA
jgi:transcriptional regulator with XRE-family HTH domain